MGGKKKAKKSAGDGDDRYDLAQMNVMLAAQVQSLRERLVMEKERKDKSLDVEEEIREKEIQMEEQLRKQEEETGLIVSEMTK